MRVLLTTLMLAATAAAQTHFQHVRPATVTDPAKQSYIVLDETILTRARGDLGDIRLYTDSGREVPYVLRTQRAVRYSNWVPARVLNKGAVSGETQFTLDVSVPEYDGIDLDLATKDFVARATVEGADDPAAKEWNNLGSHSLYDFSKEKLGGNDHIRLKAPARYRYLRITISGGVAPDDIQAASIANFQEDKARYVALSSPARISPRGNYTEVKWDTSEKLPVERITVEVDPADVNFSRDTTLFCDGRRVTDTDLSRVKLVRKGRQIESESLAIEPYGFQCKSYQLDIFNGDNPPLRIIAVKPLMLERRLYFEPKSETAFKLYYGDEKAGAPIYDYAKFFEPADAGRVTQAELKAEMRNPNFAERPDERPFTERYPAVMWVAMILAVGLLGAWALKGFKN